MDGRKRVKPSRTLQTTEAARVAAENPVQRALAHGMARHGRGQRKHHLYYDWDAVQKTWDAWPSNSFKEFCEYFGLNYTHCKKYVVNIWRGKYSTGLKSWLDRARASRIVPEIADPTADPEVIRQACCRVMEAAMGAISYSRDRLVVDGPSGTEFNNRVHPKEVNALSQALRHSMAAIATAHELAKTLPAAGDAKIIEPRPRLRIAQ